MVLIPDPVTKLIAPDEPLKSRTLLWLAVVCPLQAVDISDLNPNVSVEALVVVLIPEPVTKLICPDDPLKSTTLL